MAQASSNGILKVNVMPNPSSNYFTLNLQGKVDKVVTITITDGMGRVVERKDNVAANSTLQVGSKLPAGIYFATIQQDGKTQRIKLVKQ